MKRSFNERLAPFLRESEGAGPAQETVDGIFRGVSQITHLGYPMQRLRQIKDSYRMPDNYTYTQALLLAEQNMSTGDWRKEGEELMAQLLIEPFAAIHQTFKEENHHDHA